MNGWPMVHIGDLCTVSRATISPDEAEYDRLPSVGLEHVEAETGTITLGRGSRTGDGKSVNFRFDQKHVLYGKLRPYLNKVAEPDFCGRCSTELVPLLPRKGVERGFLAVLLRRTETINAVMAANTGSRMPRADLGVLLGLRVPRPPLAEQRRIVDIFDRAASIRRLRQQAQDTARQIVPALFHKIFGDPALNPMGWPIRAFGDLMVSSDYGTSEKASDQPIGVPVIRMGNVTYDGRLDLTDLKYLDADVEARTRYGLQVGDLLFNRTNSKELVGKMGIWEGRMDAVAASYFIRVRLREDVVCPTFVWAFFNSQFMKRRLFETARGAIGQANINAKELRALPVPVPTLDLQRRFRDRVGDLRRLTRRQAEGGRQVKSVASSLACQLLG